MENKLKIVIAEPEDYSEKAKEIYRSLGELSELTPEEVNSKEGPKFLADVLVARLKYTLDKKWFDKLPNLKVVATPTTGLNHIDVADAEKRGIKIISLRGHTDFLDKITSTAEETIGLMIALVRNLPWAFDYVKGGGWMDRNRFRGHQLSGKTLGILGLGRLGKIVARYAKAMDMKVIAADPHVDGAAMKSLGVEKVEMPELFRDSDILSVHVMLNDDTKNLVKESDLKIMKPSAYLINTARAEIIVEGALEKALKEKWIAGAAVDVMWGEEGGNHFEKKHLQESPLWQYAKDHNNLIIVPHIGGATFEAMQITEEFVADLVKKHFQG